MLQVRVLPGAPICKVRSKIDRTSMVGVAQLVEPRVVIPVVVGSSPIVHPNSLLERLSERDNPVRRLKRWMDTRICPRRRHPFDAAFDGCFPIPDCFASYDSILLVSRVQKACPRPNVRETSSIRQSNGLLIRRFGVRFPGLPPFPHSRLEIVDL